MKPLRICGIFCLEKICDEPKILFNSDNFINLKAPLGHAN
jgi:hypothetical protein